MFVSSQAIIVDHTMYISGCIGLDPETNAMVTGGLEPEAEQVWQSTMYKQNLILKIKLNNVRIVRLLFSLFHTQNSNLIIILFI